MRAGPVGLPIKQGRTENKHIKWCKEGDFMTLMVQAQWRDNSYEYLYTWLHSSNIPKIEFV